MPRPKKLYFVERGNVYCRLHNLGSTQAKRVKLCTLEELTHLPSGRKRSEAQQQAHLQALYNKVAQEKQQEKQRQEQAKLAPWFSDVVQEYLQEKQASPKTQSLVAHAATLFLNCNGKLRLDEIKSIHFSRLSRQLLESGRSPATIHAYFRHLKGILNWCVRQELLDKLPAVEMPRKQKKDPEVYSHDELQAMESWLRQAIANSPTELAQSYRQHLRAFLLMSETGCRVGECLYLPLEQIHLKERVIVIQSIPGVWSPKWQKDGLLAISDYLAEYLQEDLKNRKAEERWYLDSGYGTPAYRDHNALNHAFKKLQQRLGITTRPKGCHGFRATVATHLLDDGVDSTVIQQVLRHSQIVVTQGYMRTDQKLLKGAVNRLKKPNEIE